MLLTAEVSIVIVGALCLLPPGLGDGDGCFASAMLEIEPISWAPMVVVESSAHSPGRRALAGSG